MGNHLRVAVIRLVSVKKFRNCSQKAGFSLRQSIWWNRWSCCYYKAIFINFYCVLARRVMKPRRSSVRHKCFFTCLHLSFPFSSSHNLPLSLSSPNHFLAAHIFSVLSFSRHRPDAALRNSTTLPPQPGSWLSPTTRPIQKFPSHQASQT